MECCPPLAVPAPSTFPEAMDPIGDAFRAGGVGLEAVLAAHAGSINRCVLRARVVRWCGTRRSAAPRRAASTAALPTPTAATAAAQGTQLPDARAPPLGLFPQAQRV